MNIESKFWKVKSLNTGQVAIVQKASGTMRVVTRGSLPSVEALAAMNERAFDTCAREAFHDERAR